jgi:hypothetical protein
MAYETYKGLMLEVNPMVRDVRQFGSDTITQKDSFSNTYQLLRTLKPVLQQEFHIETISKAILSRVDTTIFHSFMTK